MINVEELFSDDYVFDHKHILNTDKGYVIPPELLKEIDNGITSEFLNKILPEIYIYRTQITIHGIFPEQINPYEQYKLVFRNKNGSIGVRYNAIDLEKKRRIGDRVRNIWKVFSSAAEYYFYDYKEVKSAEETMAVAKEYRERLSKIDKTLFNGCYNIYLAQDQFGRKFVEVKLFINAIPEENVERVIEAMGGISAKELKEQQEAEERRYKEQVESYRKQREYEKKRFQELLNGFYLERFTRRKAGEVGLFFLPVFEQDKLMFKLIEITKKRMFSYRESNPVEFDKLSEELIPSYRSTNKFNENFSWAKLLYKLGE